MSSANQAWRSIVATPATGAGILLGAERWQGRVIEYEQLRKHQDSILVVEQRPARRL